ncbi:winged helix-turn-helix domain-containing protein [Paenibacillus humicola]|uniref:winged helix-turn-helix domain-containing protein n=1 Tax=Paenibacillus humicola TaxID=3110540 RepID=UPI00237C08D7|nr:crosslink repair DNA glycosylase YcaQ family protein [Paenibacillus humicola]
MKAIRTTKRALRRLLLEKQLLLSPRGESADDGKGMKACVREAIGRLECVQIDPVSAVCPNQHLALSARLNGYEPAILNELLREREVFEYFANAACAIPMADYPIFEPVRERMRQQIKPQLDELRPVVDQVLEKLEQEGPLPAKSFVSDERVHGYWDNAGARTKATSHALNLLTDAAEIRIVGRAGNHRLFDLTRRSVPEELRLAAECIAPEEALDSLMRKYFRAYRVFEPGDPRFGWQRLNAKARREAVDRYVQAGEVLPVEVEGVKQPYYILASDEVRLAIHASEAAELAVHEEGAAPVSFLPPLDNVLWCRKRLEDLFDFEYRWEIYTPAVKRKYGYYAMPILAGDRLIGRMDPRLDGKQSHLTVQLLQIDPGVEYDDRLRADVEQALDAFAHTHGARTVSVERLQHGL